MGQVQTLEKADAAEPAPVREISTHTAALQEAVRAVGWQIIVAPIKVENVSKGGIILAEEARRAKGFLRYVGEVIDLGEACYEHPKFLNHRWCEVGDWVIYGSYAGFEMRVYAPTHPFAEEDGTVQLRVLNDDEIRGQVYNRDKIHIYCD